MSTNTAKPETDALNEANQNTRAVVTLINEIQTAGSFNEAIQCALETVRDQFGLAYGSFWAFDKQDNAVKFSLESGSVNEAFRKATMEASFKEGEGLSGRAWKRRELVFVENIGDVKDCCRAPIAVKAGVKSGICFPIIVNGQLRHDGLLCAGNAHALRRANGNASKRRPSRVERDFAHPAERRSRRRRTRRRCRQSGHDATGHIDHSGRRDPRRAGDRALGVRLGIRFILEV